MSDREEEQRGVRIVDRRRFDSEGNDRDDDNPSRPREGAPSEKPTRDARGAPRSPSQKDSPPPDASLHSKSKSGGGMMAESQAMDGDEVGGADSMHDPDITFSSFVMSLATQALMQLGEVSPPPGMEINVDRESAKHTIDILGMLHRKFGVGLEREESQLLEDILHNLRMAYVRRP